MRGSRDLGTNLSVNELCNGNKAREDSALSSLIPNFLGSADRDARKLEYSIRSSEYNSRNIIHVDDVTSSCGMIPINMTSGELQPISDDIVFGRSVNRLQIEKNDSNSAAKFRKLHEDVTRSDDLNSIKNSRMGNCVPISTDSINDTMDSSNIYELRTSISSNEYTGSFNKTDLLVESSLSTSPSLFPRNRHWDHSLGNSWGSFEFSHGTFPGVLSDILTEKSGTLSDKKTPASALYTSSGRKSRNSNGSGSRFSHSKNRNSTSTKKSESSIKLSKRINRDIGSNDSMKYERSMSDDSERVEKKRFRADDDCVGREYGDEIFETNENHVKSLNEFSTVEEGEGDNCTEIDDNHYNNHQEEEEVQKDGRNRNSILRTNHTKSFDKTDMKKNDNFINYIRNSGCISNDKKYDNYDLYLRNCFIGAEECSESNVRRILKSRTKLDTKKRNQSYRLNTLLMCPSEDGIMDRRFCSHDRGKEGEDDTRDLLRFNSYRSCSSEFEDLSCHDEFAKSRRFSDYNIDLHDRDREGGRKNPFNICDDAGDDLGGGDAEELGSFSGVRRGSKRLWRDIEGSSSYDLFCDGDSDDGGSDGEMLNEVKNLFQDEGDDDEEEGDNNNQNHDNNDVEQECSSYYQNKELSSSNPSIKTNLTNPHEITYDNNDSNTRHSGVNKFDSMSVSQVSNDRIKNINDCRHTNLSHSKHTLSSKSRKSLENSKIIRNNDKISYRKIENKIENQNTDDLNDNSNNNSSSSRKNNRNVCEELALLTAIETK